MDIVELVVSVCLTAQPAVCEEQRFPFAAEGALYGCMVRAQPYLAEWQKTNLQWTVATWKCAAPRRDNP